MQDLELKNIIVSRGYDKLARQYSYMLFEEAKNGCYFSSKWLLEELYNSLDPDILRVCYNLNQTRYYRIKKMKDFITDMIDISSFACIDMVFITFTFSDNILNSTTELARHKRIKRILDKNCYNYVANIDFGAKNEREHYHACVLLKPTADFSKYEKNGFYNQKPIRLDDTSAEKVSKYILKLTYHALKDTTQHNNTSYRALYHKTI